MRGVAPFWSQKGPIATYYREPPLARGAPDRLPALLARRDLLHVERDLRGADGGAHGVRSGRRRREAQGLDRRATAAGARSSSSSASSRRACRAMLPPEARASFQVLDEQNNKFSLAQADSVMRRRRAGRRDRSVGGRGAQAVRRGGRRRAGGGAAGARAARGDPRERRVPARAAAGRRRARSRALAADPCLRRPKPPDADRARGAGGDGRGARDLAELQRRLRLVRRYEMLRLGARELGWGTTEEVARELSAFADACLERRGRRLRRRAAPRARRAARRRRQPGRASS